MAGTMYQGCPLQYGYELIPVFPMSNYTEELGAAFDKDCIETTNFRGLCWKLCLKVLPEDKTNWMIITRNLRYHYERLLDKFHIDPRNADGYDVTINNPLSTSDLSSWNQYFIDKLTRGKIEQDVVRTFPDNEFFRSPHIQKMMINILFVYAREHPSLDYKQGMHELLAPILFVIYNDRQTYERIAEVEQLKMEVHIMFNQNYFEHDAYFMFCRAMERVEPWYINDCNFYEQLEEIVMTPGVQRTPFPIDSLPTTLHFIWHSLMKSYDLDLYNHLNKLEIAPQIYGIRWLRLLFGREFALEDLLLLWDAIFFDDVYSLFNYIFVAMLISIKPLLIGGDYTSCLNHLMRFPHVESVQFIIDLAMHLRSPMSCKCPESRYKFPKLLDVQENKPSARKGSYGPVGQGRPANNLNRNFENRPKSLSLAGIKELWKNPVQAKGHPSTSSNGSDRWELESDHYFENQVAGKFQASGGVWQIDSKVSGGQCPQLADLSERRVSESDQIRVYIEKGVSSLPCTSILNVMESKSHNYKASDLTPKPSQDGDQKISGKACQEMVPLVLPKPGTAPKSVEEIPYEIARKMTNLQFEVKRMKEKDEYCTKKMAYHLANLDKIVTTHKLKDMDENIAKQLTGLRNIKAILENKVPFTLETVHKLPADDTENLCNEASWLTLEDSDYSKVKSKNSGAKKSKKGRKNSGSVSAAASPNKKTEN